VKCYFDLIAFGCKFALSSLFTEVQSLVLAGRIGEAIALTHQLYPGLLERNTELLFILQCRQFVEIVNGTEGESVPTELTPLVSRVRRNLRPRPGDRLSPSHSSGQTSQSSQRCDGSNRMISPPPSTMSTNGEHSTNGTSLGLSSSAVAEKNATNSVNGDSNGSAAVGTAQAVQPSGSEIDVDMDTLEHDEKTVTNGSAGCSGSPCVNGSAVHVAYSSDDSSNSGDEDDYPVAEMG
jgi:Ran-binding protein 9/10